MENTISKPHNLPINSSLLIPNCCINNKNSQATAADTVEFQLVDIEMITIESSGYTSLNRLLSTSPSTSRKNSWREIPIRDPLVQHAAWAYLQPMATPETEGSLLEKLKNKCFGLFGCFNDVVLVMVKSLFTEGGNKNEDEDETDEV